MNFHEMRGPALGVVFGVVNIAGLAVLVNAVGACPHGLHATNLAALLVTTCEGLATIGHSLSIKGVCLADLCWCDVETFSRGTSFGRALAVIDWSGCRHRARTGLVNEFTSKLPEKDTGLQVEPEG